MLRAFRAYTLSAWLGAFVTYGRAAIAQSEPPLPPPSQGPASANTAAGPANAAHENGASVPAGSDCFPPCREGYVCHLRQCVSLCNPPCPSGQACIGGTRCELAFGSPGPIREPPLPPPVKPFESRGFFMLGFHYGFSGTADLEQVGTSSNALGSTFGFNLRGDVPIERFFLLGPLFQFGAWVPDLPSSPSRSYYIDADLYFRARLPITTPTTNFQFWIGVPIGLTFDILSSDLANDSGAGLGWNVGVLGGGAVHFTPNFGIFAELGWMQHKVTHDAEPNIYLRLGQWNLNLGFVFRE